jgi:DNA invertase Pin-like site-specific DNA recombinase
MLVRAYLCASAADQDFDSARADMEASASDRGVKIAAFYIENESPVGLQRPELFRLLSESYEGDVLLMEQIERLTRLNVTDWNKLKAELHARKMRVVSLDLPTSWTMVNAAEELDPRMFDAMNGVMLEILDVVARKDFTDRRRRKHKV